MEILPVIENSSINRRDFLKLKSLLIVWLTFLQSFGINIFANSIVKKIDYSLLDKLLELPFSDKVMKELKLRVELQKKYNTDANGNIHSLDRFLKEIVNFIVSQKDFQDFKLLTSINDEQIDYSHMFNTTAKHNEINSMKYLQQKFISNKNDKILHNALEYAVKSQSFDTTLHLMQQKIKLSDSSQKQLLDILHLEEYEEFYKKISGNKRMLLPFYSKENFVKRRKMTKKTFTIGSYNTWGGTLIYDYLTTLAYNSLVDLYDNSFIDEFDLYYDTKKVFITTYSKLYPLNFMEILELSLYRNGFNTWSEDLISLFEFEAELNKYDEEEINDWKNVINNFLHSDFSIYDFINLEMM